MTYILLLLLELVVGDHFAILIAGSRGYWNYRHQADVCHAQKLLK